VDNLEHIQKKGLSDLSLPPTHMECIFDMVLHSFGRGPEISLLSSLLYRKGERSEAVKTRKTCSNSLTKYYLHHIAADRSCLYTSRTSHHQLLIRPAEQHRFKWQQRREHIRFSSALYSHEVHLRHGAPLLWQSPRDLVAEQPAAVREERSE